MSFIRMNHLNRAALVVAMLSLIAAGCSSHSHPGDRAKAISSMDDAYDSLAKATAQVNKSNALLDQLTLGGDVSSTYGQFSGSITELQQAAADVKARGDSYRDHRDAYLHKWQKEVAKMPSAEARESADDRYDRVRSGFDNIRVKADDARAAYHPYINDLNEIQKSLANNQTPAGVNAIKPTIDQAKADGGMLAKKLDEVGKALDSLRGKLNQASQ